MPVLVKWTSVELVISSSKCVVIPLSSIKWCVFPALIRVCLSTSGTLPLYDASPSPLTFTVNLLPSVPDPNLAVVLLGDICPQCSPHTVGFLKFLASLLPLLRNQTFQNITAGSRTSLDTFFPSEALLVLERVWGLYWWEVLRGQLPLKAETRLPPRGGAGLLRSAMLGSSWW